MEESTLYRLFSIIVHVSYRFQGLLRTIKGFIMSYHILLVALRVVAAMSLSFSTYANSGIVALTRNFLRMPLTP